MIVRDDGQEGRKHRVKMSACLKKLRGAREREESTGERYQETKAYILGTKDSWRVKKKEIEMGPALKPSNGRA